MSPEISTALTLLAIGMITVFVVLSLVVLTGNMMIRFVNLIEPKVKAIPEQTVAVITAAVEEFTQGKGHITKIEKE